MTANKRHSARTYGHPNKKKRQPKHGRRSEAESSALFPILMGKAFLITLGIGAGLILIASLGVCFLPDPASAIRPMALISSALTALLGGFTAGKLHRCAPALCGLANGGLLLALMLLLSLFFRPLASGYSTLISTLLHTVIPVLSVLGAVIGVKRS